MIEYKVLADDPQKGLVVQGNFAPGSIPVNIPHSNPKRKQYISLFLNLRDIEAGIDYLQCISPNNHLRINEGLFISALAKETSAESQTETNNRFGIQSPNPMTPYRPAVFALTQKSLNNFQKKGAFTFIQMVACQE